MGWHFIEADATVTLHVLPAVDLEVTVGVDRDQDWTNVGLGGSEEESQNFLPEAPDPSFPLSPAFVNWWFSVVLFCGDVLCFLFHGSDL